MSLQKRLLAESVLRDTFGQEVAKVGSYLCKWRRANLGDLRAALDSKCRVEDALAVLIRHNLATFQPSNNAAAVAEYHVGLDAVIRMLRYPRYLLQVALFFVS